MIQCIVVGVIVATATETTIYYANTDVSAIEHRDLENETAKLAFRHRDEVLEIRDLPGLPPRARTTRCGFETLYATLTGDVQ
jgi:hypothetical protein